MDETVLGLEDIFIRTLFKVQVKMPVTIPGQRKKWRPVMKQTATKQNRRLYLIIQMLVFQKTLTTMYWGLGNAYRNNLITNLRGRLFAAPCSICVTVSPSAPYTFP